ncbi:MAG TPA: hypothetical protein VFH37_03260 [Candidatus Saccharimonadales bacterium]|nr:hypothetical protein [Candidatus Saccharimonadales bacterium]
MANTEFWSPLTRSQYEEGRDRRLAAEQIEPKIWYTVAHTIDDSTGPSYAAEFLVEAKSIEPIDDLFVIAAYLLNADGQKIGKPETSLIRRNGLIIEPSEPTAEGYLLDAAEKLGLGPLAVNETVLLQG